MIDFQFEGTSHGNGYSGVIRGLPDGSVFSVGFVNEQLRLRKQGYGRSSRSAYPDIVVFDGCDGETVTVKGELRFSVANAVWKRGAEITALRSGHSDVVGKRRFPDMSVRDIAEISSARNSVCYVVLGAICKQLLTRKGIFTYHYVEQIGGVTCKKSYRFGDESRQHFGSLHCPSESATKLMMAKIDEVRAAGDSLGGVVAAGAAGVPMGVGEIVPYNRRLDARIAANMMGIPSVKGVSFGLADKFARLSGRQCHDKLTVNGDEIVYATNNCGGIVAGISTGQNILCHLTVKPVPTVKGVMTVDSVTHAAAEQHFERADVCVVPNVGVIADNMLAYVLLDAILDQFGAI